MAEKSPVGHNHFPIIQRATQKKQLNRPLERAFFTSNHPNGPNSVLLLRRGRCGHRVFRVPDEFDLFLYSLLRCLIALNVARLIAINHIDYICF